MAGIFTCTVDVKDIGHKAKMLVVLTKGPKYNDAVAAAAAAREARNADAHEQVRLLHAISLAVVLNLLLECCRITTSTNKPLATSSRMHRVW